VDDQPAIADPRVFVGGVVVKDGMDDLAGGNGALEAPRKAMNSAWVCLSYR
jgi:hypothetical protein